MSYYNDLSKVIKTPSKRDKGEVYTIIPSPEKYFDYQTKEITNNLDDDNNNIFENFDHYSILHASPKQNDNKNIAKFIKTPNGLIYLHIPYCKLFLFEIE